MVLKDGKPVQESTFLNFKNKINAAKIEARIETMMIEVIMPIAVKTKSLIMTQGYDNCSLSMACGKA